MNPEAALPQAARQAARLLRDLAGWAWESQPGALPEGLMEL
jgi:hypothetical protein